MPIPQPSAPKFSKCSQNQGQPLRVAPERCLRMVMWLFHHFLDLSGTILEVLDHDVHALEWSVALESGSIVVLHAFHCLAGIHIDNAGGTTHIDVASGEHIGCRSRTNRNHSLHLGIWRMYTARTTLRQEGAFASSHPTVLINGGNSFIARFPNQITFGGILGLDGGN